jgi:hypothetical protein
MDPDPDPTLDPTPFLIDFKDAKNIMFSVRHVTGWDKDYLRKIPRVVW